MEIEYIELEPIVDEELTIIDDHLDMDIHIIVDDSFYDGE